MNCTFAWKPWPIPSSDAVCSPFGSLAYGLPPESSPTLRRRRKASIFTARRAGPAVVRSRMSAMAVVGLSARHP